MKKLIVALFMAGAVAICYTAPVSAFELTVAPNYGAVLHPDSAGDGGLGYTGRLLLAGSMFANYEVGFESGQFALEDDVFLVPITAVLRYNFYALGDIKPYLQTTAGVFYSDDTDKGYFGTTAGLGARMVSSGLPFFFDTLLRGSFVFSDDFEDDMLAMLHIGFGLGLKF